ncbi:hypothetical protein MMC06_006369, partial [Schaereria dolodes]|nr:hypothetical protein [Schaereria dolodes]
MYFSTILLTSLPLLIATASALPQTSNAPETPEAHAIEQCKLHYGENTSKFETCKQNSRKSYFQNATAPHQHHHNNGHNGVSNLPREFCAHLIGNTTNHHYVLDSNHTNKALTATATVTVTVTEHAKAVTTPMRLTTTETEMAAPLPSASLGWGQKHVARDYWDDEFAYIKSQ